MQLPLVDFDSGWPDCKFGKLCPRSSDNRTPRMPIGCGMAYDLA
jgi:hypothetical protein